jgi:hypothetical protein
MARAIEWAMIRDASFDTNFLAINVGDKEWNYQIKDLAYAIANVISGVKININKTATPDTRSYKVNFDLLEKCQVKVCCWIYCFFLHKLLFFFLFGS